MINDNNAIVNMSTKIWGPPMWTSLHIISFSYPINPTEIDKREYKQYFTLIGDILPCIICKKSYKEFIKTGVAANIRIRRFAHIDFVLTDKPANQPSRYTSRLRARNYAGEGGHCLFWHQVLLKYGQAIGHDMGDNG